MDASKLLGLVLSMAAVVILAPASQVTATSNAHVDPGRQDPWNNCTTCHGPDLLGVGGVTPSCMACHNDFAFPDLPPVGHHDPPGQWQHVLTEPRKDPFTNGCTACHGDDLLGDVGPSCFACHDQLWQEPGNSPPNVDPGGPYFGAPGLPVQFDGSNTTDPDGDPLVYLWTFGDDSLPFPSQSPTTTHTYQNTGTYIVLLTVTDGFNDPVMVETTAEITDNLPPVADPGGPYLGVVGEPVLLDASGSSDPDGDPLTYEWDFGDGSPASSASQSPTATHTYQNPGTYTAVLSVTDGVNDPVTAEVDVEIIEPNFPPVADPGGPYSGKVGQSVEFDASGTFDPDEDPLTYIWDFGDGSLPSPPSQDPTASHTYEDPGAYTATVIVSDGVNDPVTASVDVEISDKTAPPAEGDTWRVDIPFLFAQLTITFEDFAGILLVETVLPDGSTTFGIGMEFNGMVFWMDRWGALFLGTRNDEVGTMWGIVFGYQGGSSSVWFAERL